MDHGGGGGGGYFCFCYVLSLRSSEGLLADLESLLQYFDVNGAHVVIPLLGRFKGEDHSTQHLMHSTSVTGRLGHPSKNLDIETSRSPPFGISFQGPGVRKLSRDSIHLGRNEYHVS